MTEIGEYAIWFSVCAFAVALLWGFFVVAWRAREMMVKFLESARAERVWKAAGKQIGDPLKARLADLEVSMSRQMADFERKIVGQIPAAPDLSDVRASMGRLEAEIAGFDAMREEIALAVVDLKEAKSMLMSNLSKMRHGAEAVESMTADAARAAAAEIGIEAEGLDPDLMKKMRIAKFAARLDPDDPSLSMVEAAGVVLAREALERFGKEGLGGLGKSGARSPAGSTRKVNYSAPSTL